MVLASKYMTNSNPKRLIRSSITVSDGQFALLANLGKQHSSPFSFGVGRLIRLGSYNVTCRINDAT